MGSMIADRALGVSPSLTLDITAKGNKMRAEGIDVVSFGAGEPNFATPEYICNAAREALDKGLTKYTPSAGTAALRTAICDTFKKDLALEYLPSEIVVSNGAKHSLYNALMAVVNPGDEVIIPAPYWLTYPELVKLCGGIPVYINALAKDDFKISPLALKNAITHKTKAVIFNNPSNPTGTVYTKAEVGSLAKVLEESGIHVISDEIYNKLVYGTEYYSLAQFSQKLKGKTIIVNGVSKTYAMTGWRIGYTASNAELAKAMGNIQSHTTSNANSIAQHATLAALTHSDSGEFLSEMRGIFDRRRKLMIKTLEDMKQLSYVVPQGAFYVMVGIEKLIGKSLDGITIRGAADFAGLLIDKANVVTIPCESFGAPMFIRLSYAASDENIVKGLERINKLVKMLV